jgi:hypothetical protein
MAALNRLRLQYSLRSLVVFMLVASVGMSWFGAKYRAACEQRDAVAAVRALGGYVYYDAYYDYEHSHAYFRCYDGYTWGWPHMRPPPAVPPGPEWARRLLGVDFFADPMEVRFTDPTLYLIAVSVMPPPPCEPTDASLRAIARLTGLECLDLANTQITGRGLATLKALKRLRELDLDCTRVTDVGLGGVAELASLRALDLFGCNITDAGLEHLKGLSGLRRLNLSQTHVTDEGVRRLQHALPNCEITH